MAGLRGRLRERATIGVEQNRPYFTPEVANRASALQTARSQAATSWQPAAVAMPCTWAITGCGSRASRSITCEQRSNRARTGWSRRSAPISLRSCPAQKALPAPASTTTRALRSSAIRSSSSASRPSSSNDRLL